MGRKKKSSGEIDLDTFLYQRRSKRTSLLLTLPDEVLENIVRFLDKSEDLKNVSMTCRRLHSISRHKFSEFHEFILTSKVNQRLISNSIRTYQTIHFEPRSRNANLQKRDFERILPKLKLIGENITSMAISHCTSEQLITIAEMCPKLNELYWYLKESVPIPYTFLQTCFIRNILKMRKVSIIRSNPIRRSHRVHRRNNRMLH